MSRCTGHCCKAFTLPVGPDELKERAQFLTDGVQVQEMSIYLGMGWHDETTGEFVPDTELNRKWYNYANSIHVYTCKHLTPEGDCGNYENRPRMCREYPYGHPCKFKNCTAENGGCA